MESEWQDGERGKAKARNQHVHAQQQSSMSEIATQQQQEMREDETSKQQQGGVAVIVSGAAAAGETQEADGQPSVATSGDYALLPGLAQHGAAGAAFPDDTVAVVSATGQQYRRVMDTSHTAARRGLDPAFDGRPLSAGAGRAQVMRA